MNSLLNISHTENLTMSSREIAVLVEKRHDNVMRDIRAMLIELHGEEGLLRFEDTYTNHQNGLTYPIFNLPKRESLILVSGYNLNIRAKIIDRWQELEAGQNFMIPKTLPDALRLAAELADGKAKAEAKLVYAEAKAKTLDFISADPDTLTITQTAKMLGMKVKELTPLLHKKIWVYRQNGSWVPYASHIRNGHLQFKEAVYTDEKTGNECRKAYCHVTHKGLVKLAQMLSIDLEGIWPQ